MKKIILSLVAASCLSLLAACGDDPEPSTTEKCAKGLSKDCLVGTWNLKTIQSLTEPVEVFIDFGLTPSTLEFTKDGKFSYVITTNTAISAMAGRGCAGEKAFGTWEIVGSSLKLNITQSRCSEPDEGTYTVVPEINATELNLKTLVFHANDIDNLLNKTVATEYYTRAAN